MKEVYAVVTTYTDECGQRNFEIAGVFHTHEKAEERAEQERSWLLAHEDIVDNAGSLVVRTHIDEED